ncbi:DUF3800 domain-containing protein [Herbivorax sp. ANBcel31]|uniref:DUF3800 domain-containing protein n=1 Tax=Herbivorax sp. ANBcel31 TaxID=3069754 RepID=UPI0027B11DCA|nr:DUF3800 domain-containing protein [Herbivorax sp. ANBcel31]MDQ2086501.1 DUF3800 domain-containing protein [Herbivorax sp. ANBcel31]
MFNIYCDESCHLINDGEDIMVLGGIACRFEQVKLINKDIRRIKKNYKLNDSMEIKWTKVSPAKIEFYKELINYFFNNPALSFRAVIARGKKSLDYDSFDLTHDKWYYRMYYLLLRQMIQIGYEYKIYIDIKDTQGTEKINSLQEVLSNSLYDFCNETVNKIQLVRSHEIEILQLTDLLIGAISYENRSLKTSNSKIELIETVKMLSGSSLTFSTPLHAPKFNLFTWKPREV